MHTFSQIIQATFNQIYSKKPAIEYLDGSSEKTFSYYEKQRELDAELPYDKRHGLERQFLIMYMTKNEITTRSKFLFLQGVLENIFMNENAIQKFMSCFTKIQRIYHVLSKFAYTCKFKMTKILIDKDMYLGPLSESQPRVFSVVQNNKKYLFAITDLINILNTSLGNSFFFVAEPLPCKNPYTNLPFNKSTLYNIYFFIRRTCFVMPPMLHQFFVSNFNLTVYAYDNEELIRDYSIKQYINGADEDELYFEIINMLQSDKIGKKIKIDEDFPRDRLIHIMKPYLELYYKGTYTINETKRENYVTEYYNKIKRFYDYNKQFGRKHSERTFSINVNFSRPRTYKMVFNDKHIKFHEKESIDTFLMSHSRLID
jgi:hypothetical protein